jgi:hypothetical protein
MISIVVVIAFVHLQIAALLPNDARAAAADDLKKIEYRHYFRGNYEKAIEALRAFLQRDDLAEDEIVEAREYLAASLVLSGSVEEGKLEFVEILKARAAYEGPDPSVFKDDVVTAFDQAKAVYSSVVIRTAPVSDTSGASAVTPADVNDKGKPVYKKWWFYATMGAVLVIIAGAAAGGGDEEASSSDTGTVSVDVRVR